MVESNMNFDNEVLAYLSTRKVELMDQHDEYITEHPEIREILNDFLSSVLLHKPVSDNFYSSMSTLLFKMLFLSRRMMSSLLPRNTSTHSTLLLSRTNRSF